MLNIFKRKTKVVTCANLSEVIKCLAMDASEVRYGSKVLSAPWEEVTVGELLEWIEEENKKMVYEFSS